VTVEQDPKQALDEARKELAAERVRLAREDAAQEVELKEARARRAALADELIDRTRSLAAKSAELEKAKAERAKLRTERAAAKQSWADAHRAAADARQKLGDLLAALPPSEGREAQRAKLAATEDLRPLLGLLRDLLEESRTRAVFNHEVRLPDGSKESAQVVRAGMIFEAYRSHSGRVGALIAAPAGDQGWRWTEGLTAAQKEAVANAVRGAGDVLPVDVTRQLAVDRRTGTDGAWAFLVAGGPVMIPLAFVALLAVLLSLERLAFLRRQSAGAGATAEAVLARCRDNDLAGAETLASQGRTPLARTLKACLAKRAGPPAAMEDAVQEQILHELPRLERFLSFIGILTGVAPMLGLLGTVTGMMTTFDMITSLGSGDPGIMAGGIYEALITTVAGLVIAIPLLLVHSSLSSRVDRLVADLERYSASLVNLLREGNGGRAR
jgi:biopolymer transport protein ExbB